MNAPLLLPNATQAIMGLPIVRLFIAAKNAKRHFLTTCYPHSPILCWRDKHKMPAMSVALAVDRGEPAPADHVPHEAGFDSDSSFEQDVFPGSTEDRTRSSSSLSTLSGKLEQLLNNSQSERIGNYIIGKTLGEGAFAKVKAGVHAITGTNVAIKIINKTKIKDSYVLRNLRREGELMRRLRHRHVILLYEIIETEKLYCLVTETADGGEASILCGKPYC